MTGTLDEIYAAQQGRKVEISPVIWAYKMQNDMVAVDFKTTSVSFTLGVFDGVLEAESACRVFEQVEADKLSSLTQVASICAADKDSSWLALGTDGRMYEAEYISGMGQLIVIHLPKNTRILGCISRNKEEHKNDLC
nr:MAG TPA: hypothetical protein [Caudoviricetes sp.]